VTNDATLRQTVDVVVCSL